jgi:hypothetical protein
LGDKRPDFLRVCEELTTARMEEFNRRNPDCPGVLYQSFACVMSPPSPTSTCPPPTIL